MIDRTSQGAVAGQYAELTGLVPQLTTPSRNHSELVDIWFGLQWSERTPEWDESFKDLSNGRRPDPDNPSFFNLFSHAASSGLIVARQVSPDRAVWRKVEEEARALIDLVNLEVTARRTPPAAPSTRRSWSLRMRDASAFFASLASLGEPKRPRAAVVELPIPVPHASSSRAR